MSIPELVLRLVTVTELAVLVAMLLLKGRDNRAYRSAAVLLLGVVCYLLAPLVSQYRGLAGYPIILMAIMVPPLFWYFAGVVFNDDFAPHASIKWLAIATGLVALTIFHFSHGGSSGDTEEGFNYLGLISQIAKLLWLVATFAVLLKDWQADLVESRRRLRRQIVIVGGIYMGTVLIVEIFLSDPVPDTLELINVSVLWLATTALCGHFLRLNDRNILASMAAAPTDIAPERSTLAQQVVALMEGERAFASDALTMKSLADQLRVQPYQLRQVINGELGYRNFNAFINLYRIKEIAERLAQDEYRNTPLLTLALDAGFRSLAPFNRSFKDHFGVTPTEFRQKL